MHFKRVLCLLLVFLIATMGLGTAIAEQTPKTHTFDDETFLDDTPDDASDEEALSDENEDTLSDVDGDTPSDEEDADTIELSEDNENSEDEDEFDSKDAIDPEDAIVGSDDATVNPKDAIADPDDATDAEDVIDPEDTIIDPEEENAEEEDKDEEEDEDEAEDGPESESESESEDEEKDPGASKDKVFMDDDMEIVNFDDEDPETEDEEDADTAGELEIGIDSELIRDGPTHITVGNSTKVNGSFFSRQFGNNTSDIDVRAMIQGYNPIYWDTQLTFILDENVVKGFSESEDKDGNKVYNFTIHDDLQWNDGTYMTAADFVFGYVLQGSKEFDIITEEVSGDTDVWKHVVGYEEFVSGERDYFSGIRLLSKYSFSVTVKKEYLPYFYEYSYLYMMPSPISVLAPGCEVADDGKGAYIRNIDQTIEEPIFTADLLRETILDPETGYLSHPYLTCGPYSLISYDAETGIVEFHINDYWKGRYEEERPYITDITLVPVLPQDMVEKLTTGQIDIINKAVDGNVITELRNLVVETQDYKVANYARLGYGFIGLACEQGPQQFEKVRKAIAYAFDADDFVLKFLQGYGLVVYGYYGLGQWMTQVAFGNLRPEELTPEEEAIWDTFSLDQLEHYSYDPDKTLRLLIEDGWVLNENGEPFDPEIDTVRYKKLNDKLLKDKLDIERHVEGELMRLSFDFALTKDNLAAQDVLERLQTVLEPMGVEFVVHEIPFVDVLTDYLQEEGARNYDMSFLATNFVSIFDPLVEFASNVRDIEALLEPMDYEDTITEEEFLELLKEYGIYEELFEKGDPGTQNATGIFDEKLIQLCWELHKTEPLNVMQYEERWIKFQERFNEILPSVPLYSNVYYDFYRSWIYNYNPDGEANWPRAILDAFCSYQEVGDDYEPYTEETEDEEDLGDDDDLIFID